MNRDALTGLGDERKLMRDMGTVPASAGTVGTTVLTLLDLEGFKHYNDSYGRGCGDVMLRRLARRLEASVGERAEAYRTQGDEFAVLFRGSLLDAGPVIEQAAAALVELGEGFMIRAWHGSVVMPHETEFPGDALKLADQRLQQHRHDPRNDTTPALALRESRRAPISSPAFEAGVLAQRIGTTMGIAGARLSDLIAAAELRDVGMMAVPDAILLQPGGLDIDDRRLIRMHTLVGERLLSANFGMGEVAAMVRSSHEQWDGRGYPDGLAGEQIPLAARIIFAAGVFCDLTAERPHRAALRPDAALFELRRQAGTMFDPAVVEALATVLADVPDSGRFSRRSPVAA